MSLPKQLIESFEAIHKSRVVRDKDYSVDALNEFADVLNSAIPSPPHALAYAVYRFNRHKYLADKDRFMVDITGFCPYDAMVLWTDFGHILKHFGLEGKIFLGWDKHVHKYHAHPLSKHVRIPKARSIPVLDEFELGADSLTRTASTEPLVGCTERLITEAEVADNLANLDTSMDLQSYGTKSKATFHSWCDAAHRKSTIPDIDYTEPKVAGTEPSELSMDNELNLQGHDIAFQRMCAAFKRFSSIN